VIHWKSIPSDPGRGEQGDLLKSKRNERCHWKMARRI